MGLRFLMISFLSEKMSRGFRFLAVSGGGKTSLQDGQITVYIFGFEAACWHFKKMSFFEMGTFEVFKKVFFRSASKRIQMQLYSDLSIV